MSGSVVVGCRAGQGGSGCSSCSLALVAFCLRGWPDGRTCLRVSVAVAVVETESREQQSCGGRETGREGERRGWMRWIGGWN